MLRSTTHGMQRPSCGTCENDGGSTSWMQCEQTAVRAEPGGAAAVEAATEERIEHRRAALRRGSPPRGRGRGRHRAYSELAGASQSDKRSAPCAFRGRHSNGATAGPRGYWPKHGKASLVRSSPPPALDALLHVSRRSGSPYKSLMKVVKVVSWAKYRSELCVQTGAGCGMAEAVKSA